MSDENTEPQAQENQEAKLYIGNLPYSTTEEDLETIFAEVGEIVAGSAAVIRDRESGRSKGFGFIVMASVELAEKAIEAKNGAEIDGRQIVVSKARPQTDKPRFGGNGGGRRISHNNFDN